MLAAIKSEFRKLLSTRSTYILTILGIVLVGGLLCFYAQGFRAADGRLQNAHNLESVALLSVTIVATITGVVALLLITHEYRYNTIMYTLTSSNGRTKSLIAKGVVIAIYTMAVGGFIIIVGPLLTKLGVAAQGKELVPQTIDYWSIAWRSLFYSLGNGMAAFIMAFIIRNQIGAIVTYFIAAGTIEELLTLVLKDNAKFLPFRALNEVVNFSSQMGIPVEQAGRLTVNENALLFTAYMLVGLLVTWIVFIKRDAN